MNRLTFKSINPFTNEEQYYPKSVQDKGNKKIIDLTMQSKCNDKLGQLEDIEEVLGIDLLTLFKALSGQYAVKEDDGHISVEWSCPRFYAPAVLNASFDSWISIRGKDEEKHLYLKDYGKTWSFTREELE